MSLILAKNKVPAAELATVATPAATETHFPIAHNALVEATRNALATAGLKIVEEEHALARNGLRYFGGFAVVSDELTSDSRRLVVGLRNANDKGFAASICIGTSMMVCENLSFSSETKLGRRHTKNILTDLGDVISRALDLCRKQWFDMGNRISSYQERPISRPEAAELLVKMVDKNLLPARLLYPSIKEFETPRHDEFKGESLWSLYNAVTEKLKGSDLTKLPARTMGMESLFDEFAGHDSDLGPVVDV